MKARTQVEQDLLRLAPVAVQHQQVLLLPSLTPGHCTVAGRNHAQKDASPQNISIAGCVVYLAIDFDVAYMHTHNLQNSVELQCAV